MVDPVGDWVAFAADAPPSKLVVAVKHLSEPPSMPLRLLGAQFEWAFFCDWTEDGKLLVNAKENGVWCLVILEKDGTIVRRLPTAVRPFPECRASWRKYGHR